MEFKEYPRMLYHETLGTKVVNDVEELASAGPEWKKWPIGSPKNDPPAKPATPVKEWKKG